MSEKQKKLVSIGKEFKAIFLNFKNLILVLGLSFLFLIFLVTISNIQSIKAITFSGENNLFFNFFNGIYFHLTAFRTFSTVTTLLIALLFGFNVIAFKDIRSRGTVNKKTTSTTISGLVFSILGAGCSACGVLAVSFLSVFGVGALVSTLPFNGAEFDVVGIVLLLISLILILNQSITKNNCKINYE